MDCSKAGSRASVWRAKEFFVIYILVAVAVQGLASAALSAGLWVARPDWSRRRLAAIGAAPVPALLLGLSAYLVGTVLLATKEQCGVDACAYGMLGGMFGMAAAVLLYLCGMGFSALATGILTRPKPQKFTDIFS
jgi:hypothetical protein